MSEASRISGDASDPLDDDLLISGTVPPSPEPSSEPSSDISGSEDEFDTASSHSLSFSD